MILKKEKLEKKNSIDNTNFSTEKQINNIVDSTPSFECQAREATEL